MRQAVSRRRFRAVITREGTIIVPDGARKGLKAGQSVWVVFEPAGRHGPPDAPDEEEVAGIAALQAEHPEMVRRCLRAQGTFARRKGRGATRKAQQG
jgi:hypothetical protein